MSTILQSKINTKAQSSASLIFKGPLTTLRTPKHLRVCKKFYLNLETTIRNNQIEPNHLLTRRENKKKNAKSTCNPRRITCTAPKIVSIEEGGIFDLLE